MIPFNRLNFKKATISHVFDKYIYIYIYIYTHIYKRFYPLSERYTDSEGLQENCRLYPLLLTAQYFHWTFISVGHLRIRQTWYQANVSLWPLENIWNPRSLFFMYSGREATIDSSLWSHLWPGGIHYPLVTQRDCPLVSVDSILSRKGHGHFLFIKSGIFFFVGCFFTPNNFSWVFCSFKRQYVPKLQKVIEVLLTKRDFIYIYIYTYTHIHTHIYVCMCVYIYIYIYIYIFAWRCFSYFYKMTNFFVVGILFLYKAAQKWIV